MMTIITLLNNKLINNNTKQNYRMDKINNKKIKMNKMIIPFK